MSTEKPDFPGNFSTRLRTALDGRSQTSVGKRLGFSRALVSKYLQGNIPESFHFLARLGTEYGIDLHRLLTGSNAPAVSTALGLLKHYALLRVIALGKEHRHAKARLQKALRGDADLSEVEALCRELSDLESARDQVIDSLNAALRPFGEALGPGDMTPPYAPEEKSQESSD